ncbi:heavy-metal-associated domain-containing protein [Falsiroseomonas oryziterrae]|uniref:heavy-metal-associated domain-containing protein n=1 Tax=Falsiroseomonas oryziterrae TaxID=2911368 RepID=UPI001F361B32|nr:heavy-metal-associated domain-containing protein [Roseomonas sp. NPKOSM-4]
MTVELKVAGLTCGHCVRAVTEAIRAKDPVAQVEVLLDRGVVRARTTLPAAAVAAAVTAEGYSVAP